MPSNIGDIYVSDSSPKGFHVLSPAEADAPLSPKPVAAEHDKPA